MEAEKFIKIVFENNKTDYGIFLPPTDAQTGLTILIKHFLGDNWYSASPISNEQVNTEAIYEILLKYKKKKTVTERITKLFRSNKEVQNERQRKQP